MKRLIALVCASALAGSAVAGDPLSIAKQRAKDTSQQVSGNPSPARPAAPVQGSAPQPDPALAATQQNIANLANDLAALQADPLKKQPLINDLAAAAQGNSPSKTSTARLAGDLSTALSGKTLSSGQRTKLAQYLRAFFNASRVSPAQQRTILEDLQKILSSAGVSAADTAKVVADFKTIAAEVK